MTVFTECFVCLTKILTPKFLARTAGGSRSQGMRTISCAEYPCRISFELEVHYLYTFGAPAASSTAFTNPKRSDGCFDGARYRAGSSCPKLDGARVYDVVSTLPPGFRHEMVQTVDLFGKNDIYSSSETTTTPCNEIPPGNDGLLLEVVSSALLLRYAVLGWWGLAGAAYSGMRGIAALAELIESGMLHKMQAYKDRSEGVIQACFDGDACAKCKIWYQEEMEDPDWLVQVNSVHRCPCTMRFVGDEMLAPGEWTVDKSCSPTKSSWVLSRLPDAVGGGGCDRFHPGAYGCMRSEQVIRLSKCRGISSDYMPKS